MPKPMEGNRRYISGLDGLRALSVLAVILYHLHFKSVDGGYLGVAIFFVLSGYLITDLLVNEWEKTSRIDLKNFWFRRFRRLIPALIIMLILVGTWITLFQRSFLVGLRSEIAAAALYVSNWFYIMQDHSYFTSFAPPSPLQHMWSLAVEEQFYILWPIIMMIGLKFVKNRGKLAIGIFVAALVSAISMAVMYEPGTDTSRVYYGTDTRVFSVLIGASMALVWPSRKLAKNLTNDAKKVLDIVGFTSFALLLLMMMTMDEAGQFLYMGGMFLASIITAILIAAIVHPASRLGDLFSFKPLVWVGVRSYGIYIWHFPIVVLMGAGVGNEAVSFTKVIIIIVLTLLLAGLSWRFIEDPIRKGQWRVWLSNFQSKEWSWSWSEWQIPYRIGSAISGCVIIIFAMGMIFTPAKQPASEVLEQHLIEEQQKLEKAQQEKVENNEQIAKQEQQIDDIAKAEVEQAGENAIKEQESAEEGKVQLAAKQVPEDVTISAIGDSVMLSAATELQKKIPQIVVDAKIGRQVYDASKVVTVLKNQGKLGQVVVIGLGSNGDFSATQLDGLLNAIGNDRTIYLMNTRVPRGWQDGVNKKLNKAAEKNSNVTLVDWYSETGEDQDIFYEDRIHPNEKGGKFYADLVREAIAQSVNEQ
ncbi:acyltransferase family protein [Viridibacillus sp. YIM B01967]|uniref:Acyltransferase family protein n=1 Tax=Viridibacillus soli TaxID=2798301 RepID=A0ABS1HA10_9BACL|nr:acyltransferase family protein [Viridibacillus soli]MBK3496243.1 acyltransferase family protein [Viridibacillus soli]